MKNNKHTQELVRLIAENPTLPVCAMVDSDVVCDDGGRWMASFGTASVGEVAVYSERFFDEREEFKEEYYNDHDQELCERFQYSPLINEFGVERGSCTAEQVDFNEEREKALEQYLDEVAEKYFTKAIIFNINTPDEFIKEL